MQNTPQDMLCSIEHAQAARVLDDYQYGRDYIDPSHVKDGGVTKDHTRQWKVLQELQVCCLCLICTALPTPMLSTCLISAA